MKIKNYFFVFIFSLIFNFIHCAITLNDVSQLKNYNLYADSDKICNLEFDFYLEDSINNPILTSTVSSSGGTLYFSSTTQNRLLCKLKLAYSTTTTTQNIITVGSQIFNYPSSSITCTTLPSTLEYVMISNVPNKVSNSEYNINLIINNINKILPTTSSDDLIFNYCPDYFVCRTSQVGFSNYFITSIRLANNGKNIQNVDFDISYQVNDKNKTFIIKSPFSSYNLSSSSFNLSSFYKSFSGSKDLSNFLKIKGDTSNGIVNNVFLKFSNNQIQSLTPVLGTPGNDTNGIGIQLFSYMGNSNAEAIQLVYFSPTGLSVASQINSQETIVKQPILYSSLIGSNDFYDPVSGLQMVTLTSDKSNYYETYINTEKSIQFPLGFTSSSKSNPITFTKELSLGISRHTEGTKSFLFEDKTTTASFTPTQGLDYKPPQIVSMKLNSVGLVSILQFEITDDVSGFLYLMLSNGVKMDSSYLVEGTLLNGKYEYIFNLLDLEYQSELRVYKICDSAFNCFDFTTSAQKLSIYNLNTASSFPSLGNPQASLNDITSFSFKQNSIDTTNQNVFTSVYFNISNANPQTDYPPFLELFNDGISYYDYKNNQVIDKIIFQAYWNYDIKMYQIDFTIRKNQFTTDDFTYWLNYQGQRLSNTLLQSKFKSSAKLSLSSDYADTIGPIVTSVTPLQDKYEIPITQNSPIKVGWKLNIQDQFNGFKSGYVQVVSKETGKIYTTTLTPTILGSLENEFLVTVDVTGNCVSQTFAINQIYLEDTGGYVSYESLDSYFYSSMIISSLVQLKSLPSIFVDCDKIDESVLPSLVSLNMSTQQLDVGAENRNVKVFFEVYDNSGIDKSQTPICYLENMAFNFHPTKAQIIESNHTNTQFLCDIQVPIGFGYQGTLLLSIYGIFDHSNLVGFSTKYIMDKGFPSFINADTFTLSTPAIYSVGKFFSSDSKITIIGRSLEGSSIQIDYLQGFGFKNLTGTQQTPSNSNSNSILISTINKIGFPFDIRIINSNQVSNTFRVEPIISGIPINSNTNNSVECLSECGGPDHGTCTSNGCKCNLPWTGLDCLSKISLIENYTQTNPNKPTITIPSTKDDQLTKTIDILLLREVDSSNTSSIYREYTLNSWVIVANQTNGFKYTATVNSTPTYPTTINVSTVWTSINNATTIQYQVDISAYSFLSKNSGLQLVFSNSLAKASSFKGVVCSSVNNTAELLNANIIDNKLKMNQDSLLNQISLIASIDNSQGLITTQLLSTTNSILNNNNGTSIANKGDSIKSLIAVNIPHFNVMASVNSKYSIIKESKTLTSKDLSTVCVSKNVKGGYTDQKKAATAIAVVGFFMLSVMFLWFFIIKPRRDAKKL
ncbi:hypothetical protein DICPUDRAFT_148120 [Dictyostelium purpureum]|uniref:EGF-like domain-containing protein n=1 Tax=Dictyostelium purpureum TaxID=5786 RepID=F0ZAB0_DICPU|nr:uncharacterized protein DICPUDRAFT_148120 [Dictyostelium purpureum]EGC39118.1 hypothetical protein DICPUDRAFT_148120 [Dictyostelium purpureum]|eukprot:XP_003284370.1 hypothetical protein DICPUDRAFT_148120 [Dictyostelium purpureum]